MKLTRGMDIWAGGGNTIWDAYTLLSGFVSQLCSSTHPIGNAHSEMQRMKGKYLSPCNYLRDPD